MTTKIQRGVRDRLEDARVLWTNRRKEGAFIQILIAAAATSRRRYPRGTINPLTGKKYDDGAAFKQFIMDELELITGGIRYNVAFPFKGDAKVSLVDILYTHFRCPGVHEAAINDMRLNPDQIVDGRRTAVLKLTDPLGFPELWVETLSTVVWLAEENDAEFRDDPRRPAAMKDALTKRLTEDRSSFYYGRAK